MNGRRLNVAIIGMGGFAGDHHRAVQALEAQGECRLVCACDPRPDDFRAQRERWELDRRGVAVHADYLEMLDAHRDDLQVVTIPTPVPLHAPMHRACVERGLACYLEKPPTLAPAELEEMIAADARAPKPTHVGFSFIVEAERQALKRRILEGAFGPVRRVGFFGYAPRPARYYARASWAGRLWMDGRPVLDSCIGNALAHYLHNLLFWAGREGLFSWEGMETVEAQLYRAHAIEGADTVFARGTGASGVELRVAASHACAGDQVSREWVECERATVRRVTGEPFQVEWRDGRQETVPVQRRDLLSDNLRACFAALRGEAERPPTTLADSRPFVELNGLVYAAAGRIVTVPAEHLRPSRSADGRDSYVEIEGIRTACEAFLASGQFPDRQGAAWAEPGGRAGREALPGLADIVKRMSEQRAQEIAVGRGARPEERREEQP